MPGKRGIWGNPITTQNANPMRLRGLATRRERAALRLLHGAQQEPKKRKLSTPQSPVSPFPQPTKADQKSADVLTPSVAAANHLVTNGAPMPGPQPKGVRCLGYPLDPNGKEWGKVKAPAPSPMTEAMEAAARARQAFNARRLRS